MALDFQVDNKGDFIITTSAVSKRLRLSWVDSNYPVLRLNFEQCQRSKERKTEGRLILNFLVDNSNRFFDRKFATVHDKEEIRQRIMLRLRTERGEMGIMPDFGSYVVTQRHEDIMAEKTRSEIERIVLAEVSDILTTPKVIAIPKKKDGPFFCQNMNVYIYDDTELMYELEL